MLAALVTAAWAQAAPEIAWSPVLELRERALHDGALTVEQRARLGFDVERLGVSARVTFEDVRGWTESDGAVLATAGGPTLGEGWLRLEGDLTRNVGAVATIGRQPVTIHEGRILGEDPFAGEARRLDAARIVARGAPFQLEYVHARRFDDTVGRGLHVARVGASHENPVTTWVADGLWVIDLSDVQAPLTTLGAYGRFDSGRLRTRVDGYLQDGGDTAAGLFGASAGWVFGPNERLVVHARAELLTGDADGGRWRPVHGDTRTFQGLLDVYADPAARPDGLSNLQLVVDVRPTPSLALGATAHGFAARTAPGPLGVELDGRVSWWFSPFARLHAAGGWFRPADGDADRLLGYVELDATF